eukprot:108232-Chlamydomonas_euryale.AAC.1
MWCQSADPENAVNTRAWMLHSVSRPERPNSSDNIATPLLLPESGGREWADWSGGAHVAKARNGGHCHWMVEAYANMGDVGAPWLSIVRPSTPSRRST